MIGRLMRMIGLAIAYLSVGTVAAALLGLGWMSRSGRLDGARGEQIVALLRGQELPATPQSAAPTKAEDVEQPSFASLEEKRELLRRDLELRELALDQGLKTVLLEQEKVSDERQRFNVVRTGFEEELKALREGAKGAARGNVQQTLENLAAKAAKQQLLEMIAGGQIEYAVSLLSAMPIDKRADILNEFKAGDEPQKLAEILREMGQGDPEVALADETQAALDAAAGTTQEP